MRRKRTVMIVGEYTRTKKKYIIEVDGQQYEAKYIGKGYFSKVYQVGNRAVMYTRGDCAKEVIAIYQYKRMAHLPELIRHDNVRVKSESFWYVFSSPLYRNVTKKDRSAWELMNAIIKYYKSENSRNMKLAGIAGIVGIDWMQALVNGMRYENFPRSIIRALQEIVHIALNCGNNNVGFDFKKSNFGVNQYGTLILRDIFFVKS